MMAIWREYDPRVMIVFVVCLAIGEVFVQIRWRMAVQCKHCGFDPVLYKKAPDVAAEKVKIHLQRRKKDPQFLLAPPLNLPARKTPVEERAPKPTENTRGRLVSRQI